MWFSPIQWVFAIVFGFWIARPIYLISTRAIPRGRGLIWLVLWTVGLIMVSVPELSNRLARLLGVTRGTDAVVYTAIAFLSVLVFRAFRLIDHPDRQISKLTTALALKEWSEEQDKTGTEDENSPA